MSEEGPEKAIAAQEEYLKRMRSCSGILGLSHSWERIAGEHGVYYWACHKCGVTRSSKDYSRKLGEAP